MEERARCEAESMGSERDATDRTKPDTCRRIVQRPPILLATSRGTGEEEVVESWSSQALEAQEMSLPITMRVGVVLEGSSGHRRIRHDHERKLIGKHLDFKCMPWLLAGLSRTSAADVGRLE